MKHKATFITVGWPTVLLIALLALSLSGCAYKSTPPGPGAAGGQYEGAAFSFLRWKEGLAIVIWHDLESFTSHGSGSTTDPVYRLQGSAESRDGRHVDWVVETDDGKTARFWIDDTRYDLSAGALFVITTEHDRTNVMQLERDLSGVQPNYESCVAFARNDPDLTRLIGDALAGHINLDR
jgi:hypothetical protein